MSTLRQVEANRKNALRSTGPRTEEGKEQSRKNALKHGLSGAGVVLPEQESEAVAARLVEWQGSLAPTPGDEFEAWLAEDVVVASVQVDRCRHHERVLRAGQARRASVSWEQDRKLAATLLGENLARKPAAVSQELRRTPQGCDWLMARWTVLGQILEIKGAWTEPQRALALDLLGTPPELRDGPTRLDDNAGAAACVRAELEELRDLKENVLADLDEHDRAAAELGLEREVSKPLARLRRYESTCRRRLTWALKQLRGNQAQVHLDSTPEPEPEPAADMEFPDDPLAALDPEGDLGLSELIRQAAARLSAPAPSWLNAPVMSFSAASPSFEFADDHRRQPARRA